jgi:hypothetical protein
MIYRENKSKIAGINSTLSILSNVTRLNNPVKQQRLSNWIKRKPNYILSTEDTLLDPKIQADWKLEDGRNTLYN